MRRLIQLRDDILLDPDAISAFSAFGHGDLATFGSWLSQPTNLVSEVSVGATTVSGIAASVGWKLDTTGTTPQMKWNLGLSKGGYSIEYRSPFKSFLDGGEIMLMKEIKF